MDMHVRALCAAVSMSLAGAALGQPVDGGGYLELDGVDDLVSAEGEFLSQTMTVELWVKPVSVHDLWTAGVVAYGSRDLGSFDFGIGPVDDTRLRFFINHNQGQQTIIGTQPIELGEWQHIAATYDGETARLYINGQLDAELVLGDTILPSDPDAILAIGDDYPGASEFVGGSFDEVRMWNVVRTESEIADAMFTPLEGDEEGLIAYYDFDECGSQVALDRGPNAYHGKMGLSWSRGEDDPERMVYAPSRQRCLALSSSDEGEMRAVVGMIDEQLAQINAGPPALGWTPIINRHADMHTRDAFMCGEDNLDRPYVDSETFLAGADEISWNNCDSAFYRVSFTMPPIVESPVVFGVANADDLGVLFINGRPVSLLLTMNDVTNLGEDRDFFGHRLLGWPTADPFFEDSVPDLIVPGKNTVTFGVTSDASELEPGGLEFEMVVQYDCIADWDADGSNDTIDFTSYLNDWVAKEPEADLNRDGKINTQDVMVWLNLWSFGCPE